MADSKADDAPQAAPAAADDCTSPSLLSCLRSIAQDCSTFIEFACEDCEIGALRRICCSREVSAIKTFPPTLSPTLSASSAKLASLYNHYVPGAYEVRASDSILCTGIFDIMEGVAMAAVVTMTTTYEGVTLTLVVPDCPIAAAEYELAESRESSYERLVAMRSVCSGISSENRALCMSRVRKAGWKFFPRHLLSDYHIELSGSSLAPWLRFRAAATPSEIGKIANICDAEGVRIAGAKQKLESAAKAHDDKRCNFRVRLRAVLSTAPLVVEKAAPAQPPSGAKRNGDAEAPGAAESPAADGKRPTDSD
ncbi:MAG: hypothetical protein VW891_18755, partial [Novosphingobium sp.]